jgi:hypothetical protein
MKILMYGFGEGSNIQPWLDYLEYSGHKTTFVCKKFGFRYYDNIHVLQTFSRFFIGFRTLFTLLTTRFDVVYIQGLYDYPLIFQILLFSRAKVKVVQVWNNKSHLKALKENKKWWQRPFYRWILNKADRIHFEWYGVLIEFNKLFPDLAHKTHVKFWGVRFVRPEATFKWTRDYIESLGNSTFIFWPETMTKYEHIGVFIEAVRRLKYPVRVLLFCGSQKWDDYTKYLKDSAPKNVDIVLGNYLPYCDILALWERCDISIKLSTKDALSLGILEALYMRKPVLLNNWQPYKLLKQFGFFVRFTTLESWYITKELNRMIEHLSTWKYDSDHKEKNHNLIKEHFDFNKNVKNIFDELSRL